MLALLPALHGLVQAREVSVIVGFRQKPGAPERAMIRAARGVIHRGFQRIPAVAACLPQETVEHLRRSSRIAYIEENALYRASGGSISGEYGASWGVRHIRAGEAHATGNRGEGVRVAVLDTGIDYSHADLNANYRGGHDFVFNDADPFDDSFNSHGTRMAGIIAAEQNGAGVVGVAPEAGVLAVKVLDGAGFGTVDSIIAGIEWAVANGADIINLSLEGPDRQSLRDACDEARRAGVLLIAAAGNSLVGSGPVEYPAAYESVIAVTGTDTSDLPGAFAPVGETLGLAAPGVGILSTISGGQYEVLSGTSEASAHVAGAAALFLRAQTGDLNRDGTIDPEDAALLMLLSATDLGAAGKDAIYGYGTVNAAAASLDSPLPAVVITEAAAEGAMVTIHGTGFGGYAVGSITSVTGAVTTEENPDAGYDDLEGTVISWSNEMIVAEFAALPRRVTVMSVFGTDTEEVVQGVGPRPFLRGDSNNDGNVDLSDAIHSLEHLFLGGPPPSCPDAGDSDDNSLLEIHDAILILDWLFRSRGHLAPPGPESCGPDPTEDTLPPCDYHSERC